MIDELSAKISGIGTVVCRYVEGGLGDLLYPLTVEYRGAASSESAAGAPGPRLFLRLLSRPRFRPSRGRVVAGRWWVPGRPVGGARAGVSLGLDGCEVRLCDPCARVRPCVPCVSRVCPGSPRCLFTGTCFQTVFTTFSRTFISGGKRDAVRLGLYGGWCTAQPVQGG